MNFFWIFLKGLINFSVQKIEFSGYFVAFNVMSQLAKEKESCRKVSVFSSGVLAGQPFKLFTVTK